LVEGYGLKKVMVTPGVDFTQTKTNHIIEMEEVLGIEAAR
jgi:DNA-directed RNA polymerase III subunit RPC1